MRGMCSGLEKIKNDLNVVSKNMGAEPGERNDLLCSINITVLSSPKIQFHPVKRNKINYVSNHKQNESQMLLGNPMCVSMCACLCIHFQGTKEYIFQSIFILIWELWIMNGCVNKCFVLNTEHEMNSLHLDWNNSCVTIQCSMSSFACFCMSVCMYVLYLYVKY